MGPRPVHPRRSSWPAAGFLIRRKITHFTPEVGWGPTSGPHGSQVPQSRGGDPDTCRWENRHLVGGGKSEHSKPGMARGVICAHSRNRTSASLGVGVFTAEGSDEDVRYETSWLG